MDVLHQIGISNLRDLSKYIEFLASFKDSNECIFYFKENEIKFRVFIGYRATFCDLVLKVGEDYHILQGNEWEKFTPFIFDIKNFYAQLKPFFEEYIDGLILSFSDDKKMYFYYGSDKEGEVGIQNDFLTKKIPFKEYDLDPSFDVKLDLPSFHLWADSLYKFRGDEYSFKKVLLIFKNQKDFYAMTSDNEKGCFIEFNDVKNEWQDKCFMFDPFVLKKIKKSFKNEKIEHFAYFEHLKYNRYFCVSINEKLSVVSYCEFDPYVYDKILGINKDKNYIVLKKKDLYDALIKILPYSYLIDVDVRVITMVLNKNKILMTPHYTIDTEHTFDVQNENGHTFGCYFNANYLLGDVLIHVPYDVLKIYFDEEKQIFIITDANGEYKENFVLGVLKDIEPKWKRIEREMDEDD
jgi:hypothetical protein